MTDTQGSESMQRSIPFLWGLVIILLILNLILLDALNLTRLTAIETLSKVEMTLDSLANEVIVYNIEVSQAVPMKADVPLNRTIEIPLNTVIPIDQVLTVPFQTPAGEVMLDVPVKTNVPIDIVAPVSFNQTINVDTVVQLNTTLPVEIDIAQTPLAGHLIETKMDIARLRSRLALKGRAVAEEAVPAATSYSEASANPVPDTSSDSQPQSLPTKSAAGGPVSELGPESGTSQVSQHPTADLTLSLDDATDQANLGLCAHSYWPLWPGIVSTHNSRDTSYTQRVIDVSNDQVFLSTQYEGRDIQFSLMCSQEGLGGDFLGDIRRITELGDLKFSNPRGVFLPRPERVEEIGRSWTQELDVSGTVQAIQVDSLVAGKISRGQAVAVYTPVRFETVETPSGPQEALRVEQRLDLELGIDFDLGGQTIPATEIVNLNTIYWFVKDIGLVKVHWQGGTLQQIAEIGQMPVNQQSSVPALAEDQLVSVCITLTDQSLKCAKMDGFSQSDLTVPPESELTVHGFTFPGAVGNEEGVSIVETSVPPAPGESAGDDKRQSDSLAYVEAVESLGERLSGAAEEFWGAALEFRNDQITLDEFRNEFLEFAPKVGEVIQEVNQLSPPSEAAAAHQKLTNGLAKCDQAVDLMYDWFDSPNSETKEAAALLVAECVEDVTTAGEELMAIEGQD